MFLFLSKALPPFVMPLGLVILLMILAAALLLRTRGARRAKAALLLSLLILWAFGTPACADALLLSLEARYPIAASASLPEADAVVVLGGGTTAGGPSRPEIELGASSGRLMHGFRIFKSGRAPRIILSGGTFVPGDTEAEEMERVLLEWGTPRAALLLEMRSRNTHENAVQTLALARKHGLRRLIVVTSAFHMPRAAAIFRKEAAPHGVQIIPAPTCRYTGGQRPYSLLAYLPEANALANSSLVLREFMGLVVYRARGWM